MVLSGRTNSPATVRSPTLPACCRMQSRLRSSPCYHVLHLTSMEKDFDRWNRHKKKVNDISDRPFYHTREIWWCAVGVNVGNELDGTGKEHDRPVLVIRPFNAETFFGVALIGHPRVGRYYFPLGKVDDREAVANLSQA